jgi:hypothetical protein
MERWVAKKKEGEATRATRGEAATAASDTAESSTRANHGEKPSSEFRVTYWVNRLKVCKQNVIPW